MSQYSQNYSKKVCIFSHKAVNLVQAWYGRTPGHRMKESVEAWLKSRLDHPTGSALGVDKLPYL
jgi:hypothetical protein